MGSLTRKGKRSLVYAPPQLVSTQACQCGTSLSCASALRKGPLAGAGRLGDSGFVTLGQGGGRGQGSTGVLFRRSSQAPLPPLSFRGSRSGASRSQDKHRTSSAKWGFLGVSSKRGHARGRQQSGRGGKGQQQPVAGPA